jgi:hypothetical protein
VNNWLKIVRLFLEMMDDVVVVGCPLLVLPVYIMIMLRIRLDNAKLAGTMILSVAQALKQARVCVINLTRLMQQ